MGESSLAVASTIPKLDTEYKALDESAQTLMEAAERYITEYRRAGLPGGKNLVFISMPNGPTVVYTQGPYNQELIQFVQNLGKAS